MPKRKGPTWDEIHDTANGNRIVHKDSGGYNRMIVETGKTRVEITCPFCKVPLWAYKWSLAGGGKRCSCGAMCGGDGVFPHWAEGAS